MAASAVFEATYFESNYLSQYFLNRIKEAKPSFDKIQFLLTFDTNEYVQKVDLVRDKLLFYKLFPVFVKDIKKDEIAIQYRLNGQQRVQEGNHLRALESYTNCLAMAESEEVRALAHADRSECFLALGMPKQCMDEIDRALTKHHPQKDELVSRRERASALQESAQVCYEEAPVIPQSQRNDLIQCASDTVNIENNEAGLRKHVTASRDIGIGEIISVERPYSCAVFPNERLFYCHHCLELCYNLIPCEHCTQALFCNEKCKEKAQKAYHKFECTILLTLNRELVVKNPSLLIALRTTFSGMNDYFVLQTFDHDNPKYYHSDRYNEIHNLKPPHEPSTLDLLHDTILAAFVFQLLWTNTSFFNTVSSLWCNKNDYRNKFKEVLLLHLSATKFNAVKIYNYVHEPKLYATDNYGFGMYSFFSLFAHSCCANIMKSFHGTTMVLRALNTIKKGQKCFVNRYGLRYDAYPEAKRSHMLSISNLPNCTCTACLENWTPSLGDFSQVCTNLGIEDATFDSVVTEIIGVNLDKAKEYLPRLIELLKDCEEEEPSGNALTLKKLIAHCYVVLGNKRML